MSALRKNREEEQRTVPEAADRPKRSGAETWPLAAGRWPRGRV